MIKLKETREDILKKAEELGKKYIDLYAGCAQCTFLAITDALRWGGLELITMETEEKLYPGISLLTAGVCMTGEGTCGAVASSVMALGLYPGKEMDNNMCVSGLRRSAFIARELILNEYFKDYRSILCKDIQRKYFKKAWDLTDDKTAHEFLGITNGCIILDAIKLAVNCILDENEKGNQALNN